MIGLSALQALSSLCSILIVTTAMDTLTAAQFIRDGNSIVSAGGSFELGFFSPGNSKNRYVGIWYKRMSELTVVWVANRESPLVDSSGVLMVTQEGILILLNGTDSIIWTSNPSRPANNPAAKLLESGNLVLKDANDDDDDKPENFFWQSFDYPSDTILPGMKFGRDTKTGLDRFLWSWKSMDDPARGDFTHRIDPHGYPQYFLRKGSVKLFRLGPWNGLQFSGFPSIHSDNRYNLSFVWNEKEMYFMYKSLDSSVFTRLVLNENGVLQRFASMNGTKSWLQFLILPMSNCDNYGFCGAYGSCSNTAGCVCLRGFKQNSTKDWLKSCVRITPLDCSDIGDGFLKYSRVKLPDTEKSWFNLSMTLKECEATCLKNCSCVAYANSDISTAGGSGCLLWFGGLVDIREVAENGHDLYVKVAASELVLGQAGHSWKKAKRIIVILVVSTGTLMLGLSITLWIRRKKRQPNREGGIRLHPRRGHYEAIKNEDLELQRFDLATITNATDNFAINNKLGQGGFGPVYKGILEGGQEIAVKLLSKNSRQGIDEFMNEVICIAKLQHRNLVKLLGYCIQGEENILIYEYMPNNSLDSFIFDQTQRVLLDWPKRFHIINGIARGLLYLHQDSRLRIIHRDLKGSNILLDHEMNPKISDFGLARIFGGNETEANTKRVVGTYGYMSPEYAIDGIFSIKSDVFSFGVLVLEIVSGKRNRGFCHPDHHLNLLGHAWTLHKEGRTAELVDTAIQNSSSNLPEVLRSIHVGLLCVQQRSEDRPNMSSVALMLGGEGVLAQPKQPGYFTERDLLKAESSLGREHEECSANMVTITLLEVR